MATFDTHDAWVHIRRLSAALAADEDGATGHTCQALVAIAEQLDEPTGGSAPGWVYLPDNQTVVNMAAVARITFAPGAARLHFAHGETPGTVLVDGQINIVTIDLGPHDTAAIRAALGVSQGGPRS